MTMSTTPPPPPLEMPPPGNHLPFGIALRDTTAAAGNTSRGTFACNQPPLRPPPPPQPLTSSGVTLPTNTPAAAVADGWYGTPVSSSTSPNSTPTATMNTTPRNTHQRSLTIPQDPAPPATSNSNRGLTTAPTTPNFHQKLKKFLMTNHTDYAKQETTTPKQQKLRRHTRTPNGGTTPLFAPINTDPTTLDREAYHPTLNPSPLLETFKNF
eukprot:TRINITY_DN66964_c8_g6_i1.p1 TRINITY_DN66964_c8_g6~~TRINITY_DN66964_c8_g6_i1.p1  ORF type:complete len:219 (+),score=58.62 TRINITY_DN66964_c8_g6_i1:26-658(+)